MKSYIVDDVKIRYLGEYHPYDHGTNPNFDDYSRSVLNIKDGRDGAEVAFVADLEAYVRTLPAGAVLAYYPSSKAGKEKKGLAALIKAVAREEDEVIPDLLLRARTVE